MPGAIVFVEVKAPGKHPFKLQKIWLSLIRALGHNAVVIDTRPKVDALMIWYERFRDNSVGNSELSTKLIQTLRG